MGFMEQMLPQGRGFKGFYGLGTFNLGFFTGQKGTHGEGYGHLGATYGFQSIAGYFPGPRFAMAIATNIETNNQVQPSDTFCFAYNAALGALTNSTIRCTFKPKSYYGGACTCNLSNW